MAYQLPPDRPSCFRIRPTSQIDQPAITDAINDP
jgi:hypothetical protein